MACGSGRGGLVLLVMMIGGLLAARPAVAAQAPGEPLYEQATKAMDADKDWPRAIDLFHQALDAAGDTEYGWKSLAGLGWAYQHMGNEPYAAEFYERFLAAVRDHLTEGGAIHKDWRKPVRLFSEQLTNLQKSLAKTHGVITVTSDPPGATVLVDGRAPRPRPVTTPYSLYVLAGPHEVAVELDGKEPVERSVHVAVGATVSVQADHEDRAAKEEKPTEPPADALTTTSADRRDEPADPIAAYALIGSGAVLAMAGGVLVGLAVDADSQQADLGVGQARQYDDLQSQKEAFGIAAGVTGGVGIAILTAGVILLVMDDDEGEPGPASPALTVTPIPGGAAAAGTWRF